MATEPLKPSEPNTSTVAVDRLATAVYAYRPVLESIVASAPAGLDLKTYVERLHEPVPEPLQSRDDFITLMASDTKRIFGPDRGPQLAAKMQARLTQRPVIITANHTALVDCFPILTQSTLLAAMAEGPDSVVPILAGGGIPADNAVDPLGPSLGRLRVQETGPELDEQGQPKRRKNDKVISATTLSPIKMNLLPSNRFGKVAALKLPAFTQTVAQQHLNSVGGLYGQRVISKGERNALAVVLGPDVLQHPEVQAVATRGGTFSEQAMVANNLAYKQAFAPNLREEMPEVIFGELERITGQLLASDLEHPETLAYQILFNDQLREKLLTNLNGVPGCWDTANAGKEGTQFFWGFDERTDQNHNSPVALQLVEVDGQLVLRGKNTTDIPFTPASLTQALRERSIIPGLFMNFTALSFARGVKCFGGFMQTDYLTRMKIGLTAALQSRWSGKPRQFDNWGNRIAEFPTENYICGMTPVLARYPAHEVKRMNTVPLMEEGIQAKTRTGEPAYTQVEQTMQEAERVQPAGLMEIIAAGGLTREQWEHMQRQPFVSAGALALPTTYPLVVPAEARTPELSAITSGDIFSAVGDSFVTLDM